MAGAGNDGGGLVGAGRDGGWEIRLLPPPLGAPLLTAVGGVLRGPEKYRKPLLARLSSTLQKYSRACRTFHKNQQETSYSITMYETAESLSLS